MSIKLISVNVRGINETIKRRAIFNFYRGKGNIICLQETHSTVDVEQEWTAEWKGDILFAHGTSRAKGVSILMPKGMINSCKTVIRDPNGRFLVVVIKLQSCEISICNIYAPNVDSPHFFKDLFMKCENHTDNLIVVGDFNLVMNPQKDRIGSSHNNTKALDIINNFCEQHYLSEIWRQRNSDTNHYSWYRCKPRLSASRIDYALLSQGLCNLCINVGYTTGLHTDHLAFYLFLSMDKNERGKGYWKMNTQYLRNVDFLELINNTLDDIEQLCVGKHVFEKWEYLKF